MKILKNLDEAQLGETVVLVSKTHGRDRRRYLVPVTKVTAKQLVVEHGASTYRFWKSGRNSGAEVGSRSGYFSSIWRSLRVATEESLHEIEEETPAAAEEEAKMEAANKRHRVKKAERRDARFEGKLDRAEKTLRSRIEAGQDDDRVTCLMRSLGNQLERLVWDLESNEKDLRSEIEDGRRELDRLSERLENDHHLGGSVGGGYQADGRLAQIVNRRQGLIEAGGQALHLANGMLYESTDEEGA